MNEVTQNFDASNVSETVAILKTEGTILYIKNGRELYVPVNEGNRYYQEIMGKIDDGTLDLKVDFHVS